MTDWEIRQGEDLEDLQNGYFILQPKKGFRFGMDAVLLAAFAGAGKGARILDLGCGTGIIPILMCARTEDCRFTGLEIQTHTADMALRSVRGNHLQDRISIVQGDIREAGSVFGAASFDVVVSNPPYMPGQHGLLNPDRSAAIARHEVLCSFQELAPQAARVLTGTGKFFLVHRPFRLAEIIAVLKKNHLEPKRLRLVHPFADREPNLFLLEAARGGRPGLTVEKPLIIYREPGVFTDEVKKVYEGAALS